METAPKQANDRKKYLIFGGLGVLAIVIIAITTWGLLKAYAPVKTVASVQDASQGQSKSSTTPLAAPIIPTATTSAEVDSLQTSLQADSANDATVNNALNDTKQQITVPTE